MKNIYFVLLMFLLFSCTNDKKQEQNQVTGSDTIIKTDTVIVEKSAKNNADKKQQLAGNWKEHWGIGMETNVNSSDIFQIEVAADENLTITCPAKKKFAFDQVLFDGKELTFRKQNKSYPKGKFYVYYRLKLNDNAQWMEGPITNNKKQKDYVKWEKVSNAD